MSAVVPASDAASPRDASRLSSLDGLRAISIALVIFEHLRRTRGYTLGDLNAYFGDYGRLGVTVFFVISGFLITTLLLRERERRGAISLKGFYLRRAVRIFPAFLAFMAFIVVANAMGWIQLNRYDLVSAFTYTVNYHPGRSWYIGHLWSLSVEEQFYLLWPLALVVLSRTGALVAAAVVFCAAPFVRIWMERMSSLPEAYRDLEVFPAVADAIAIGCILAMLRPWLLRQRWYLAATRPLPMLFVLPLIALVNRFLGYGIVDLLGEPVALLAIGVVVEASTRWTGLAAAFLNSRPMVLLGTLSYSLYLWQQVFLDRDAGHAWVGFPLNVLLAIAVACASYYLLERPLLDLRRRLAGAAVDQAP